MESAAWDPTLVAGILGMSLLAFAIILFMLIYQRKLVSQQLQVQQMEAKLQKELVNAAIQAQEKERKRIAQDLHDEVGAMLSTVKLSLNSFTKNTDNEVVQRAQETKSYIDETITTVRNISRDLLPATLERLGLGDALEELCEKLDSPETRVQFHQMNEVTRFAPQSELALYRISLELINNAIKHANASEVNVSITQTDQLQLVVEDNGDGFDYEAAKQKPSSELGGLGLKNIESRINFIGAGIHYDSIPKKGTKVTITLHIPNQNH